MVETVYHIPNAPRLALLADLHGRPFDDVIRSLGIHKPEIICIAGDIVYGSHPVDDKSPLDTQENVLPFLKACASLAPTFLSLGNHEWMLDSADLAAISDTGVTVLDNTWTTITVDGREIVLGGLTSGYVTDYQRFRAEFGSEERYPRKDSLTGIGGLWSASDHIPETAWLQSFAAASPESYHILISHHPLYIRYVPESVDLILSGHLHGSQWLYYSLLKREWRGVFNPDEGWFPKYSKGVYENRLVISAGLSNTTWIPRINNPTEVVLLEP